MLEINIRHEAYTACAVSPYLTIVKLGIGGDPKKVSKKIIMVKIIEL